MLIIVEGVDCAGKDWVASELLKKLGKKLGKKTFLLKQGVRPTIGNYEEIGRLKESYHQMIDFAKLAESTNSIMIFDRYYHSELAYSMPMREYESLDDEDYCYLENFLLSQVPNTILVFVTAEDMILEKRLMQRGDDYVTLENILEIKKRYENIIIPQSNIPVITIENNDLSHIDPIIEDIRNRINEY